MKHSIRLSVDHPVLKNHCVFGQHLLPGLAYIDLLYQFFRKQGHDYPGLELRNLSIYAPLIVSPGNSVQLDIDWQEVKARTWQVVVDGREVPKGGGSPGEVRRYCTAQMQYGELAVFSETLSIEEIKQSAQATIDAERLYEASRSGQLVHTGPMKALGEVYATTEALYADLRADADSAAAKRGGPMFDPTLIDGAAVCIRSTLAVMGPEKSPGMSLPLFYESFRASAPLTGRCATRVQLASVRRTGELSRMTIEFFDDAGRKVAELRNFTCKLVRDPAAITAPQSQPARVAPPVPPPAPVVQVSASSRRAEIENLLRRLIAERLQLPPEQVSASAGFYEIGLQSAALLDLVTALDKAAGISLSPTLLFEYTTIADLAEYLDENHGESFAPTASVSSPIASPGPIAEIATSASPRPARRAEIEQLLRRLVAERLQLAPEQVNVGVGFYELGLQSAVLLDLVRALDSTAETSLSPTLLFEYTTIADLAAYLDENHGEQFALTGGAEAATEKPSPQTTPSTNSAAPAAPPTTAGDDIAIIGVGGRFPMAENIAQFWQNLTEGKDCITEIPSSRWDWRYLKDVRTTSGKSISRWGGFLEDPSRFDAMFFRISPREAETIDPQERIFLETCWEAIEDAGYTPRTLAPLRGADKRRAVGVFAGIMHKDYVLAGAESGFKGQFVPMIMGIASVANRVSYFCNLHGPSIAVDTACSSSLTAVHLAVESLRRGECDVALAGGVNLSVHNTKYICYGLAEMHSSDGRCRAFGEGGDGYVSGEGSGAVLLKPLARAIADGDQIYAVIKATCVNHVGTVSGFTVPSPVAQADVITECLNKAGVHPRTVSYVEAHGTGTSLGDPIEIQGITRAYRRGTEDAQYCAIGSVKSNVGHTESAAGVCGLIKIALQMKHRKLVPSLHADTLNSHVDWKKSPFFVQKRTEEWQPARTIENGKEVVHPRRAALSSFGASGSNAHVILEESPLVTRAPATAGTESALVPLSARNPERLLEYARKLLDFVRSDAVDLHELAFTLQVGREPMDARVAFVVSSLADLRERLQAFIDQKAPARGTFVGQGKQDKAALDLLTGDGDSQELIGKWMSKGRLEKLAEVWAKGLAVEWSRLNRTQILRRISAPTYPFARDRYWIPAIEGGSRGAAVRGGEGHSLHPLLHSNTSDFSEQRFSTQLVGEEFYLRDHRIAGEKVLPGAAYLEMVRAAVAVASGRKVEDTVDVDLLDTVWQRPLAVGNDGARVHVALYPQDAGEIEYEVYAEAPAAAGTEANGGKPESEEQSRVVYAQGRARLRAPGAAPEAAVRHIADLEEQCTSGVLQSAECYEKFSAGGLQYGVGHRVLRELRAGRDAQGRALVLAQMSLPQELASTHSQYVLHPALMDGALQACIGITLLQKSASGSGEGSAGAWVPYALERLECRGACPAQAIVIAREVSEEGAPVRKFDIEICDTDGAVKVLLKGFSSRPLNRAPGAPQTLLLTRQWELKEPSSNGVTPYSQRHVLLCEVGEAPADVPDVRWKVLTSPGESVSERYMQYGQALLQEVQGIFRSKPTGAVRLQVVVPNHGDGILHSGMAAALKSAQQENPQLHGQVIGVDAGETSKSLWERLQENVADEAVEVRYKGGQRFVPCIKDYASTAAGHGNEGMSFKAGGVYLISGGAGGLGRIFAREIFRQAPDARVILTGRRPLRPEQLPPDLQQAATAGGGLLQYRVLDVTDAGAVRQLIKQLVSEHGHVNGVIHSAGVLRDSFLIRKSAAEIAEVLGPKVCGTENLDEATADQKLDFFALFSSLAGVYGNVGQSDYALANAFLDEYAHYRDALVKQGARYGRTVSINWPLWDEGGMQMPEASRAQMQAAGILPLEQAEGLKAFEHALSGEASQVLVVRARPERLRPQAQRAAPIPQAKEESSPPAMDHAPERQLQDRTLQYLKKVLSGTLKLPVAQIDGSAPLEQYGIDSIMVLQLTKELEQHFGALSKTLFFEYQTLEALAQYLLTNHAERVKGMLLPASPATSGAPRQPETPAKPAGTTRPAVAHRTRRLTADAGDGAKASPADSSSGDIAIIGLSGRYPQARNLEEFWKNLRDGRDCISEIPADRWDHSRYFDARKGTPGKVCSKWGGFIDGVDEFDPLFFNISPREAEMLDPQERLFLQCVYSTLEDAGYTRETLGRYQAAGLPGNVGVFVGVMYEEYQLYGAQAQVLGHPVALSGSPSSIANRVSYFCNLHGPSIAVDSMCSSSLTAIHLAAESLRHGGCELAIAGGVNVSVHPNKYLLLSQGQFAASSGRCESFGQGGDGYVPGEGVGAVLLKPLAKAIEDGDHIYGVIKASALNHGGKTNGYTVPNPLAQSQVISRVLAESKVPARAVTYIEAHGTGTSLGDPIEITGLTKAFSGFTEERQFCAIGSVKSNIGHCESAAGIAAVTKVLLQMKHGQLVPSLHADVLNPHIDFDRTPFVVQRKLSDWNRPLLNAPEGGTREYPRIAGLSSFGAGGSNAHLLIQEYVPQEAARRDRSDVTVAIVLSAKTDERLQAQLRQLHDAIAAGLVQDALEDVAYTLQTGREAMEYRIGFAVSSLPELQTKLAAVLAGEGDVEGCYRGEIKQSKEALSVFTADEDLQHAIEAWIAKGKYAKLLELWVKGLPFDWQRLYVNDKPRRVSLPTYPFAREQYWVPRGVWNSGTGESTAARVHPLLHTNTSDFSEYRFSTRFGGDEFYLRDHQVAGERVLPAAAYLEMVRAALANAGGAADPAAVELQDVVWQRPLAVGADGARVHVNLRPRDGGEIDYEVYSGDAGESRVVYAEGRARIAEQSATTNPPTRRDLAQLGSWCTAGVLNSAECYEKFSAGGLQYGTAHRVLTEVRAGRDARGQALVLASISLPEHLANTQGQFVLHPAMLDGALQACVGITLLEGSGNAGLPYALEALNCYGPCAGQAVAIVHEVSEKGAPVRKFDIELCDTDGTVKVSLKGLSSRPLKPQGPSGTRPLLLKREWQLQEARERAEVQYNEHHVVLCEVGDVAGDLSGVQWEVLNSAAGDLASRYVEYAQLLLGKLQRILRSQPAGNVRVQVVVPNHGEDGRFAGLVAALKTAQQENPQLHGQLIAVESSETPQTLLQKLRQNATDEAVEVRYDRGQRRVPYIKEYAPSPGANHSFKSGGVYLISGGAGGLGQVFAREILRQAPDAHVILTGRRALSTGDLPVELQQSAVGSGSIQYRALDVTNAAAVNEMIRDLVAQYGRVDGVIHSAGVLRDSFLIRKTTAEAQQVLAPKVYGAQYLDEATRDQKLDFFVLFASLSGVYGNVGQADYALANAYLDEFAYYRQSLVRAGERYGQTVSIDWPLWAGGGMQMPEAAQAQLLAAGYAPLTQERGISAFTQALAAGAEQVLVVNPSAGRVAVAVKPEPDVAEHAEGQPTVAAIADAAQNRQERTRYHLKRLVSRTLKIAAERIDVQAPLEQYGIDSVLMTQLTRDLEQDFGPLPKTLFFEYQSIEALAQYFISNHDGKLSAVLQIKPTTNVGKVSHQKVRAVTPAVRVKERVTATAPAVDKIAIVGISGRFPHARTVSEFWKNLADGKDCVTEVPSGRWDHSKYFDTRKGTFGKSYSKWGAFIDGVDEFDPLFFNISPIEAQHLDPQERLFLETVWILLEEQGLTREKVRAKYERSVGMYVGSMYHVHGAIEGNIAQDSAAALATASAIANRASYFFGLQGPSIGVDTMCSSSLTAIHMACADLLRGDCRLAIAGGVNLSVHPKKYIGLSQMQVLASDPASRSFEQGDGYVPAEAVGAILLKPLSSAIADGDEILGVIRATAVNHGGRSNGYFVPNLNAQSEVIATCLRRAEVDPGSISYVEAAAAGSPMADPVELAALNRAFSGSKATDRPWCVLGSVKSAIGHAEAASTMTQLAKVLMQLRHRQIVPSVKLSRVSSAISLEKTPFRFQQALGEWSAPTSGPRRVLVNSFGAGGSNAALLLEEYVGPARARISGGDGPTTQREVIVLSARTPERLVAQARQLQQYLQQGEPAPLSDIAYTLQTGREAMESRLALVVTDQQELVTALQAYVEAAEAGQIPETACPLYQRASMAARSAVTALATGAAGEALLEALFASNDLERLALFWTEGGQVAWERLHTAGTRRIVRLPTYPFARGTDWITDHPQSVREQPQPARPQSPGSSEGRRISPPQDGVRQILGESLREILGLDIASIDPDASLLDYGLNSLTGLQLVQRLNTALGVQLQLTLVYDNRSVNALVARLSRECKGLANEAPAARNPTPTERSQPAKPIVVAAERVAQAAESRTPVAIIGVSGRFPRARSVEQLWENLIGSRDCISDVPPERWSLDGFYHPDTEQAGPLGKSYCKWGGFMDGALESDPAFFAIKDDATPPGTRQVLEVIWTLLESAGYTREALAREHPGTVGVYLGMMPESYGSASTISSYVSSIFNCRGPCVTVETMSASSMTALHVACDGLACGDCDVAIVIGMCLLTPEKLLLGSRAKVLGTSQERARPFANGDGTVLSEGVGAVMLKRLPKAIESGDAIRAVIRTSWLTHRGSSEFSRDIFANTLAQKIRDAGVDARSISYIESAATGDPNVEQFELAMLTTAFRDLTDEEGFCRYATVKSNIGHGEAASAIQQLIKVVLQLEHRQLPPLINQQWISPDLKMERGPFVLQRELEDWERPRLVKENGDIEECPRRALVLSFGAGGQGGVLMLEEYVPDGASPDSRRRGDREELIVLSAKNPERLRVASAHLLEFVRKNPEVPLADIAYTLQVGREPMAARLAVRAGSHADLERHLQAFLDAESCRGLAGPDVWFTVGTPETHDSARRRAAPSDAERELVQFHLKDGDLQEIAALWIGGAHIPWDCVHSGTGVRRISLPTYPFARVPAAGPAGAAEPDAVSAAPKNEELELA